MLGAAVTIISEQLVLENGVPSDVMPLMEAKYWLVDSEAGSSN